MKNQLNLCNNLSLHFHSMCKGYQLECSDNCEEVVCAAPQMSQDEVLDSVPGKKAAFTLSLISATATTHLNYCNVTRVFSGNMFW